MDMVPKEEREQRVGALLKAFKFKGPVFQVSALSKDGCDHLVKSVFEYIKSVQVAQAQPEYVDPRFVPGLELNGTSLSQDDTEELTAQATLNVKSKAESVQAKPKPKTKANTKTKSQQSNIRSPLLKKIKSKKHPLKKCQLKRHPPKKSLQKRYLLKK